LTNKNNEKEVTDDLLKTLQSCDMIGNNIKEGIFFKDNINNTIHHISKIEDDNITISWNNNDNTFVYLKKDVIRYFNEGTWKEVIFKPGDWVITKGYDKKYDGKPLRISRISRNNFCYFDTEPSVMIDCNFGIYSIERFATKDEIHRALSNKERIKWKEFIDRSRTKIKSDNKIYIDDEEIINVKIPSPDKPKVYIPDDE